MNELVTSSVKQLLGLIKNKKISCKELIEAHLTHIAAINPKINAIVQPLSKEKALEEAHRADEAIANHQNLGKLHGIPITIKDARKVKGFLCTYGNESPLNHVATEDATVVARLRAEGAIVIGVTNIPDFSMTYETENSLYGRTNNPYDLDRSPGGSSGGEAAIIAAGGSTFGIGADSGGSIRQPAHNCGIAALKPTRGLIPDTGKFPKDGLGIFNLVETQGPFARRVEDLIYTLPILAGPDGIDPNIFPIAPNDPTKVDLKKLRVAFYTGNGVATPRQDIIKTINDAAEALTKDVASMKADYPIIKKETYSAFEELFFYGGDKGKWLLDRMEAMQVKKVAAPFQALLDFAKQFEFSVTEVRNRLLALDQFKIQWMKFMSSYDVILCPVATFPARSYTQTEDAAAFSLSHDLTYNLPFNITGWPAAVVRCGTSSERLPIGVQVIAKAWRDDIALAVAKRLEEIFGGWQPPKIIN